MTNARDNYLLDALRFQLKAVGVQVCYGEAIGWTEVCLSSGDTSMLTMKKSPFKGKSLLPSIFCIGKFIVYESIVFGPFGSGSHLSTILLNKAELEFEDKLISHHVRFQSALDDYRHQSVHGVNRLTTQEKATLTKFAGGLVAKQIAEDLNLSEPEMFKQTVNQKKIEKLSASARDKLAAKTITEAVYKACITRQLDYEK